MADTKLSDLTAMASKIEFDDLLYLVDVSDTSDWPGGSSRRATLAQMARFLVGETRILTSAQVMTNNTSMQNWFTSNSSLSLAPNKTYFFEGFFASSNGATSHGLTMQFAAITGATILWHSMGGKLLVNAQATAWRGSLNNTFATARNVTTASTVTGNGVWVWGRIWTTLAGTFTPRVAQTAASGSFSALAGTYMSVYEIGDNVITNTGGWA
jgi:hypothetical protein